MAGDDLALVLGLLNESDSRWRTLRAEGEEWVDPDRSKEAFFRSVRPGSVVTARIVVARTPTVVVAVDRVVAYPSGFELGVAARSQDEPLRGSFDTGNRRSWSGTAAFAGASLTVRLDGDLTVVPVSGSGTQTRFDQRFWVMPLPPPGPVGVVLAWPARDVAEIRAELDGAAVVDAAAQAETLWP
jgi:hypothetical protein